MKKTTLLLLSAFFTSVIFAQSVSYEWTQVLTGTAGEYIWNFASDKDNNIYGVTDGSGFEIFADTSFGSGTTANTVLFRLSPEGTLDWLQYVTKAESGEVTVDNNKNVYTGGWYAPSATFGPYTLNSTPGFFGNSSYFATLDSLGHYSSATHIYTGYSFANAVHSIVCNAAGDVAYGDNREKLVGMSTLVLTHSFVKKNKDGSTWTKLFDTVIVTPMHVDVANNTYITGTYNYPININGTPLTNSGGTDTYFAKLNAAGTYQWIKKLGGNHSDLITDVITDTDGNAYICGYTNSDSLQIDAYKIYADITDFNSFIIKVNADGSIAWARGMNSDAFNSVSDLYIDPATHQLMMLGYFSEDITLGSSALVNTADYNYFIARLDASGNPVSAQQFNIPSVGHALKLRITDPEHIVMSGYFTSTLTLGADTFTASGTQDGFISKLHFCETPVTAYADIDGDGYGNAASSVSSCSAPEGYVLNSSDCNDADALINPAATEICNTLDDDCNALIDDNTITAVITPSAPGSICKGESVPLNASTGTGYTYQWLKNGMHTPVTTATYNANKTGNYQVVITTSEGCSDTSAATTVTVLPVPTATITTPEGTDLCGHTSLKLKANGGAGFSYQWIKGGANIPGATLQTYFATATGNYKVKVTNASGCTKTSAATGLIKSCREGEQQISGIVVYPNPAAASFYVQLPARSSSIVLLNMRGEIVYQQSISETQNGIEINRNNLPAGIYLIKVYTADAVFSDKVILE